MDVLFEVILFEQLMIYINYHIVSQCYFSLDGCGVFYFTSDQRVSGTLKIYYI